jgi:folylpolyglutamate synthase/dihydropteroate synthase
MDVLGNSEEEIAAEKAFVIKSGVKAVIGPTCT